MNKAVGVGATLFALLAYGAATAQARIVPLRLQGTFTMLGTVTTADHVFGEHRGQHVRRTWEFSPPQHCVGGNCRRALLERRRSGLNLLDVLMLARQPSGHYVGQSSFWVPLRCAGQIDSHGGLAIETINVRVTRTRLVGTTHFATAVSATYTNPSRVNHTRCPGAIGHDAASYSGRLISPLPKPPHASFTTKPDLATSTGRFTDHSTPGRGGGPIVARSWNFGDLNSPGDTSTQTDPTHRFSAPGTYTVTLTVRDSYGQTSTTTARVTV